MPEVDHYDYARATYRSLNPLRKFAHKRRFQFCQQLLDLQPNQKLLDYGCGDGWLLNQLSNKIPNTQLIGFEPFLQQTLTQHSRLLVFQDFKTLTAHCGFHVFDCVACFEVLEHFSEENQLRILADLVLATRIGEYRGKVVISTPIEIGIPALVKNLMRLRIGQPQFEGINLKNIWASLIAQPPQKLREKDGYLTHMGFDFRRLEYLIRQFFVIEKCFLSPFPYATYHFNSQIFWICRPQ